MLQELIASTEEGDWAVAGCLRQVFPRFFDGNYLRLIPDLWNGMLRHYPAEECGQPRESLGTQVFQELYVDVVIAWGCCRLCLLQGCSYLFYRECCRKALVSRLSHQGAPLNTDLAFKLLVAWGLADLDKMSTDSIRTNRRVHY